MQDKDLIIEQQKQQILKLQQQLKQYQETIKRQQEIIQKLKNAKWNQVINQPNYFWVNNEYHPIKIVVTLFMI